MPMFDQSFWNGQDWQFRPRAPEKANPKPIPDNQANAAKSGCQFPANLAQLNLTAHRQAWASKFWPAALGKVTIHFIANRVPINVQSKPIDVQSGANSRPIQWNPWLFLYSTYLFSVFDSGSLEKSKSMQIYWSYRKGRNSFSCYWQLPQQITMSRSWKWKRSWCVLFLVLNFWSIWNIVTVVVGRWGKRQSRVRASHDQFVYFRSFCSKWTQQLLKITLIF